MTRLRGLLIAFAALGALVFAAPALAATPNAPSIQIVRGAFSPATVTIKAGGSITLVNMDGVDHTITSPAAKIGPTLLHPTDNLSALFPNAGTFAVTDAQNAAIKPTVVVENAAIATVHLAASPKGVIAGHSATLRGTISPAAGGQQVRVEAQACGSSTFSGVKTLTTAGNGAFALKVTPLSNTSYRVRYGEGNATVSVQVRPKLVLRKIGARRYAVTVTGAEGKLVSVQSRPSGKGWRPVGKTRLRKSVAHFTLQVAPGTLVRASVDPKLAGACLGTGVSNAVRA
jgi:plastocyanin